MRWHAEPGLDVPGEERGFSSATAGASPVAPPISDMDRRSPLAYSSRDDEKKDIKPIPHARLGRGG